MGSSRNDKGHNAQQASIFLIDQYLFYTNEIGQNKINLQHLSSAFVGVIKEEAYLILMDQQQHFIDVKLNGFHVVYPALSTLLGFDDKVFFSVILQKHTMLVGIWAKSKSANFRLHQSENLAIEKGYQVLCVPPVALSWDLSYGQLRTLALGHFYKDKFQHTYFCFDYPLRIGTIELDGVHIYFDHEREDVGIQSYFCDLSSAKNGLDLFDELCGVFSDMLPLKQKVDTAGVLCEFYSDQANIEVLVCPMLEPGVMAEQKCIVTINNNRDYKQVLQQVVLANYQSLSVVFSFENAFDFVEDYRCNSHMFLTPQTILALENGPCFFWLDKLHDKVGFSCGELCFIYELSQIKAVLVQHVNDQNDYRYTECSVVLHKGMVDVVYVGQRQDILDLIDVLTLHLGIRILLFTSCYNC